MLYELLCDSHHPYPNSRPMVAEPVIDPRTIRSDLAAELAGFLIGRAPGPGPIASRRLHKCSSPCVPYALSFKLPIPRVAGEWARLTELRSPHRGHGLLASEHAGGTGPDLAQLVRTEIAVDAVEGVAEVTAVVTRPLGRHLTPPGSRRVDQDQDAAGEAPDVCQRQLRSSVDFLEQMLA